MLEHNKSSKPDFTLNFVANETAEFDAARTKEEYPGHLQDEAADVCVVSFIALPFWSNEEWRMHGSDLMMNLAFVIVKSGLSYADYARKVTEVIEGKNSLNYMSEPFVTAGNTRLSSAVYKYTAAHLKDVRKSEFDGRLPADANIVFKHRNNGARTITGDHLGYKVLYEVATKIENYREKVGAVPIL